MSTSTDLITSEIGNAVDEHVEHRALDRVGVHALAHGQVALGIEVDHEHSIPTLAHGHTEVQGGRRLRDAALLVREGDDVRHQRTLGVGRRDGLGHGLEARRLFDGLDRLLLDGLGVRLGARLEPRQEA
jgi:hypothetical protein